jgi:hypothetical protein
MTGLRAAGRVVLGLVSVLAGIAGCVALLAATALLDPANVILAWIVLTLGFLGLGVTRHSGAPWRPVRLSLTVASVMAAYMVSGLPWPPKGTDLGSAVLLAGAIVASITAGWTLDRAPRVATALLIVLALYGLFILVRFTFVVRRGVAVNGYNGPAMVLSFALASCVGAAWIASVWHARAVVRRAFRDPRGDA